MSVNLLSATARELDKYPGLGLPLRQYPQYDGRFFPMGAHANCYGSKSELLPVREVAMMNVMDRLTDKKDWHEKVFDNEIVEKWRKEALEIPDDLFWNLARVPSEWGSRLSEDTSPLKEIMNSETFDYVSWLNLHCND